MYTKTELGPEDIKNTRDYHAKVSPGWEPNLQLLGVWGNIINSLTLMLLVD